MSFREKNAWIAVATTLIVWGYYFLTVWNQVASLTIDGQGLFTLFLVCMTITFVVLIGLNLIAARIAGQQFGAPEDERERAVDRRASWWGARLLEWMLLGVAALGPTVIAGYAREGFAADPAGATAIIMANAILFCAVLSQVVREAIHIVSYRLMAAE
jgi:Na+-driven multidrug efflux pump